MPLATAPLNAAVDAATQLLAWASLHSANPGITGANELAGGGYARQPVTWLSAAGAVANTGGLLAFSGPGSSAAPFLGVWSAVSGGTFRGATAIMGDQALNANGVLRVTVLRLDGGDTGEVVNALQSPSTFGWPDETNTGPSGALTPSGSIVTSSPGQVIEGLDITGVVEIAHDNVIIRNCKITGPDAAGFPGNKVILGTSDATDLRGLLVEDCELTCAGPGSYQSILGDINYTLRRSHIHNMPEGPRLCTNTRMEDCYLHTIIGNDPEAHSDTSQTTFGDSVHILRNTYRSYNINPLPADATSCFLGGPDVETLRVSDFEFSYNLLDGAPVGGPAGTPCGYLLYIGQDPSPTSDFQDATALGNRFGRNFQHGPLGVTDPTEAPTVAFWGDGNVWDDDNSFIGLAAGWTLVNE